MKMFKTYISFFFLCCEKKYFIQELSTLEDVDGASVLQNVNVQINFLIKDLLLW